MYSGDELEKALNMICQEAKSLGDANHSSDTPGLVMITGGDSDREYTNVGLKFFQQNPKVLSIRFSAWPEQRLRDLMMENDMKLRLTHMEQAQVYWLFL